MRSVARGSPMTPVDATRTWRGAHPPRPARQRAVAATASRPPRPVKALALPALTTRQRPSPRRAARRDHSTGAAAVFEVVKRPATAVPGATSARNRSRRPL